MKKVFLPFFLIGAMSTLAATGTGTATVTIVSPLAIGNSIQDMSFGKINAVSGGTVSIGTNGSRTKTGNLVLVNGGSVSEAKFSVSGDPSATYSITLPAAAATLSNGSSSLPLSDFVSDPTSAGALSGGSGTIHVGGTLTVGSGQAGGTYTGTFAVTVEYN